MKLWKQMLLCLAGCMFVNCSPAVFAQDANTKSKAQEITVAQKAKIVTLEGKVENWRPATKDTAPNSFTLRDDSGSIRVCIWKDEFDKVLGKEKLADGAMVTITGEVNEFRSTPEVHIKSDGKLTVSGTGELPKTDNSTLRSVSDGKPVKTGSVKSEMKDQTITVCGKLTSVKPSTKSNVPWMLTMNDGSGPLDIVFWAPTAEKMQLKPATGETWRTTGKVSEFKTKLQLRAEDAQSWKKQEATQTPSTPDATTSRSDVLKTGSVKSEMKDQTITVCGKLTSVKPSTKSNVPWMLTMNDGSGPLDIVFWAPTAEKMQLKPVSGETWSTKGKVGEFKGKLQLRAEDADTWKKQDIATTETASSDSATPTGSVTVAMNGKVVNVVGDMLSLSVPKTATAPYVMKVDDGSGTVDVVFWKPTVDALKAEQKAEPGNLVSVSGIVNEHRGNVQIKLENSNDLKTAKSHPEIVKPIGKEDTATSAIVKTIKINELSTIPPKSKVNIKVRVKANEKLRAGQCLTVTDDSGSEAHFYIWDNALGLLRDEVRSTSTKLPVGATISANAVVSGFEGKTCLYINKAEDLQDVTLK